jgi:hypothetical protein
MRGKDWFKLLSLGFVKTKVLISFDDGELWICMYKKYIGINKTTYGETE